MFKNAISFLVLSLFLTSCDQGLVSQNQLQSELPPIWQPDESRDDNSQNNNDHSHNSDDSASAGDDRNPPADDGQAVPVELGYSKPVQCTRIDFKNLRWSKDLTQKQIDLFATALNISGSFEGQKSWSNLTNNFDGMGLSMGLLNQTLGTGSLQPLLIQMRNQHYEEMRSYFATARFSSLLTMINSWEKSSGLAKMSDELINEKLSMGEFSDLNDYELFASNEQTISVLDEPSFAQKSTEGLFKTSADPNSASVTWAVNNLYTGSSFKTDWKSELSKLSDSINYRVIQLTAAQKLHTRALFFFNRFKFTQVRAYLLMYDFIVQNGGFYQENIDAYDSYLKSYPKATELEKLNKLLEIRLTRVRTQYVADVRARKSSIINGTGKVHGSNRNLPNEFCYNSTEIY